MEKDEEPGDNVMHRGAEPEGRRRRKGGGKASSGERGGRGGMLEEEEKRESTGCVHLALGGRER